MQYQEPQYIKQVLENYTGCGGWLMWPLIPCPGVYVPPSCCALGKCPARWALCLSVQRLGILPGTQKGHAGGRGWEGWFPRTTNTEPILLVFLSAKCQSEVAPLVFYVWNSGSLNLTFLLLFGCNTFQQITSSALVNAALRSCGTSFEITVDSGMSSQTLSKCWLFPNSSLPPNVVSEYPGSFPSSYILLVEEATLPSTGNRAPRSWNVGGQGTHLCRPPRSSHTEPESCSWSHGLWHRHMPRLAVGCQMYFGCKVLVSPMSSSQSHTACPDNQPHSPADLYNWGSRVEQHFQQPALHWHLSKRAGHFGHSQSRDFYLFKFPWGESMLSKASWNCFPCKNMFEVYSAKPSSPSCKIMRCFHLSKQEICSDVMVCWRTRVTLGIIFLCKGIFKGIVGSLVAVGFTLFSGLKRGNQFCGTPASSSCFEALHLLTGP